MQLLVSIKRDEFLLAILTLIVRMVALLMYSNRSQCGQKSFKLDFNMHAFMRDWCWVELEVSLSTVSCGNSITTESLVLTLRYYTTETHVVKDLDERERWHICLWFSYHLFNLPGLHKCLWRDLTDVVIWERNDGEGGSECLTYTQINHWHVKFWRRNVRITK